MSDIVLLIQGGQNAEAAVKGLGNMVQVFDEHLEIVPNKYQYSAKIRFPLVWKNDVMYHLAPEQGPSYNDKGTPYEVLEGDFPSFKDLKPV
jgi:hypothetical protein